MSYVMVAVPESRVREIYGILAGEPPTTAFGIPPAPTTPGGPATDWSIEEIARMYRESPSTMQRFLDYLADHVGREFTAPEMASVLGRTQPQFRGVLGAFGHRVHSRYGWTSWPIGYRWDTERRTAVYHLSTEMAEMIRSAR